MEGTGRGGERGGGGERKKDMKITIMTSEPLNSDGTYFYCTKRQHIVCRELNDFQKRLRATIQRKSMESRNPVSIGLLLTNVLTHCVCVCVFVCVCMCVCVCVCLQHDHEVVAV